MYIKFYNDCNNTLFYAYILYNFLVVKLDLFFEYD